MKNITTLLIIMLCFISINNKAYAPTDDINMLAKINEYREANELTPLEYNEDLVNVAEVRVNELPVSFEHKRPNGDSYKTVYTELKLTNKFERASENIAQFNVNAFGSSDEYMDAIFKAYTESESHNLNMLKPYWKYYGGSFLIDYQGESYQIQVFAR